MNINFNHILEQFLLKTAVFSETKLQNFINVIYEIIKVAYGNESEAIDRLNSIADNIQDGRRPGTSFLQLSFRSRDFRGNRNFPELESKLRNAGAVFARVYQTEAATFTSKTYIKIQAIIEGNKEDLKRLLKSKVNSYNKSQQDIIEQKRKKELEEDARRRVIMEERQRQIDIENEQAKKQYEEYKKLEYEQHLAEAQEGADLLIANGIEVLDVKPREVIIKIKNIIAHFLYRSRPSIGWNPEIKGWYYEGERYPAYKSNILESVKANFLSAF